MTRPGVGIPAAVAGRAWAGSSLWFGAQPAPDGPVAAGATSAVKGRRAMQFQAVSQTELHAVDGGKTGVLQAIGVGAAIGAFMFGAPFGGVALSGAAFKELGVRALFGGIGGAILGGIGSLLSRIF
jgi:hypothetical protein